VRPVSAVTGALACSVLLTGCGESPAGRRTPSVLDARGDGAEIIRREAWVQFTVAALVFALVAGIVVAAVIRSRAHRGEAEDLRGGHGAWLVVAGGIAMPLVVLTVLFVVSARDVVKLSSRHGGPLMIEVTAHRWWWEVRYPGLGIVTANEIALPVGTTAALRVTSADVVHTFWVPQLQRKIDAIPGERASDWIEASRAGVYRGVCTEFCGLEHARMHLIVQAMPQARFAEWAKQASAPARPPSTAAERRGAAVFTSSACAVCHTIRGTAAGGDFGPDLTHLGSRPELAAAQLPNTPGNLGGWIADPQSVKPGAEMPSVPLTGTQLRDVIAYLESLR
jgi:cytochrome c oxidase subunit II